MPCRFAEVIVNVHNRKVDRAFHYAVPEKLPVVLGSNVIVPFNGRTVEGIVIGFSDTAPVTAVKPVLACIEGEAILDKTLIELARWIADYYLCPFIEALQCILPASLGARREIIVEIGSSLDDPDIRALTLLDPELEKLVQAIWRGRKPVKLHNLTKRLGKGIMPQIEMLAARGFLNLTTVYKLPAFRDSVSENEGVPTRKAPVTLTPRQLEAVSVIDAAVHGQAKTVLVHGITGSGKTQVYLHAIAHVLQEGKSAIVLVPEITLTPQIYREFSEAFPGQVAVLHSGLTDRQRANEYKRIVSGAARVVVGARSAIFAPLRNLGLIIIDEEHEQTYKQEENPKYHVHEVAKKRAELCGCTVVLGSATPSLESYALALSGRYTLVTMGERVGQNPLPPVEVVDLREELLAGNHGIFSRSLLAKMTERFSRGEQAILFLNRRGFSTFIICRECGYVAKCPHCDISLTYHSNTGLLRCHYCGYTVAAPQDCPSCSSRKIKYFGLGTEKIEHELNKFFPNVKALRLDADTTTRQGAHRQILAAFERGEAQALIGTQMVAKGLDFPNVTLVGVVSADVTLNMPDFRAKERTFQLITQVAGRAGRGVRPGDVVVQTFSPQDPSIKFAQTHDYQGFFTQEIGFRRALGYPPFNHILQAVLTSEAESSLIKCAQDLDGALRQEVAKLNQNARHHLEILGPAPCPLRKLNNRYRWQLIVKGKKVDELKAAMGYAVKQLYEFGTTGGLALSLDVDPIGMI
ncbi:MAG TPA: primosomal protein N' [Desulfobacteria bacterium]|nr:primosomal protein N' [Desulfobacteria bacterium]